MYTKTTAVHRPIIVIFEKSHLNLEYNDAQISRIFYLLVTQINVVRLQNECWNKTYKKSWTHYFRTIPTIWIWEKNISLNYWISGRLVCIIYFIFLVTKSRSSRSARHLYKKEEEEVKRFEGMGWWRRITLVFFQKELIVSLYTKNWYTKR